MRSPQVTEALSNFVEGARAAPMGEGVIEKTKHHIVDTVAAALSGVKLDVGARALAAAGAFTGHAEAVVFGCAERFPAYWAAMFNAMLAHADETDDSHERSKIHPGCGIVPSALAVVQRHQRSGLDLVRAVAAGYDVGARMTEALGGVALNDAGVASHAVGGLWGSGGAAAVGSGFDAAAARHLWSYLAHETSGLACWMEEHDHVQKAYVFGAMGAKNAVTAAILCESGWTGLHEALEGKRRLLPTLGQRGKDRGFDTPLQLGEEILASNIKKWCVGSPVQAVFDALEVLVRDLPAADQIVSVSAQIRADESFVVDNRDMPNICLQHLAALFLCDGGVTFESVHDRERMTDPRVLALRSRVTLVPSDVLQQAGGRQAIVSVALADGRELRHHVRHVRGTWGDPMARTEVDEKASGLMAPLLGAKATRALLDGLWSLELLDGAALDQLLARANKELMRTLMN